MLDYREDESLTDNFEDDVALVFFEWLEGVENTKPELVKDAVELVKTLNRLNNPNLTTIILSKLTQKTEKI
jgi:hypothetical protein